VKKPSGAEKLLGELTNVKQLFRQRFDPCIIKLIIKKFLQADFLAIATQELVNAKYWAIKS
jgi:hypothetical protein